MRKTLILLLLASLLLCGCDSESAEETTLPTDSQPTEFVEPAGIYAPESDVEAQTGGAVRGYVLENEKILAMEAMGDALLVFSGTEKTVLTSLTGENLYIQAQVELPFLLEADAVIQCAEKGMVYVDPETGELVFLDQSLKEVRRVALPEDAVGMPLLSADRQNLYYCTADSIKVMDLENGIRRLMKQITYPEKKLQGLLLEESILHCAVTDESGKAEHLFLRCETGETLVRVDREIVTASQGQTWYARLADGSVKLLLTGDIQLSPRDITAEGFFQPAHHTAVTVGEGQETTLDRYDLESGLRTATVNLGGSVSNVISGPDGQYIWFLRETQETGTTICRWDTAMTPAEDQTVYAGPHYTIKNPDTQGLARCAAAAKTLAEQYGVEIFVGADAVKLQPEEFEAQAECSVPVIEHYLRALEKTLALYPEDFFRKAMSASDSGRLKICLVRSLTGRPQTGNRGAVTGDQFWLGREAYLFLTAEPGMEESFLHQMCHAMETQVFAKSGRYDDWDKLNPEGFVYDFDYIANAQREGGEYLEGENRAFIDTFSMSFPKEDRATFMVFAMTEGNEELFQSKIMQEKLTALCEGIREAFGWKKSEETFLWEQYLAEPMAYQPKK